MLKNLKIIEKIKTDRHRHRVVHHREEEDQDKDVHRREYKDRHKADHRREDKCHHNSRCSRCHHHSRYRHRDRISMCVMSGFEKRVIIITGLVDITKTEFFLCFLFKLLF